MTPMFLVIVALGTTDLIFALDSIPAIYGLTQEPYLVFTANVFALMGLRQLYFLLGDLLKRLVYLSQGLAVILAFIGVKLVLHALHENELPFINGGEHVPVPEIPTLLSLGVIIVVLVITTVASLYKTRVKDKKARGRDPEDVSAAMSLEVVDGVSVVRFDHPPVNALDLDVLDDVVVTMRGLDGPVVITGAGRCFSAGVDLRAIVDGGAEYTDRFMTALSAAFLAVFDHPAPVVAAINGHAIAGGCVFAMAADIRLMAAGTIGLTELAVGAMFPMAALEICRHAMGTSTTQATLGAGTVDVATAAALGWVDEIVTADELLPRAIALAHELGEYAPAAYAMTKEQLHRPARTAIDAGAATDEVVRASWMSEETHARIAAYMKSLH